MRVSKGAAVRRGAVLEQEDALPSAELQPSVGDGDAELGLGQRALDVGRHVVRPFVIVAVELDAATKLPFLVPPHSISWSHLWMRVSLGETGRK